MGFVAAVGRVFIAFLTGAGRLAIFTGNSVIHCVRPPIYPRLIGRQMVAVGYYSLPVVGVFGGYLVSVYKLGFNPSIYLKSTWKFLEPIDVISGLVKAGVFSFLISLMGCYHGYHSKGGAQEVGAATTNAVVSASILIMCTNSLITEAFFSTAP